MEDFDYNFYLKMYDDLRHFDEKQALQHYFKHGKKEKRVCNKKMMDEFQKNTIQQINNEYNTLSKINFIEKEKKINILIRTSNRPEYFDKCIKSVLEQNYKNYEVFVCYDKKESLNYLLKYKTNEKITYFLVNNASTSKYKYNLYCNNLLHKVNNGFIIFLDDDDKFCHNLVFKIVNKNLEHNYLHIWKYFRPDKIIFPKNCNKINLGEITGVAFSVEKKLCKNCDWWDKRNGDFNFISKIVKKNKVKIKKINFILSMAQFNNKIAGLGK